ncbi:hypothetical protein [Rhizobium sp. C1]|uniref:hypothetical protein n=1 Tax=Rhizobium sp. C1 TaxID=1349799 RepID=UPI001E34B3AF|nr:hypothetical protein [Rhizobium sp. C1]MCD2176952.1 hypothetical protein [Rhizobium sp. C1]
MANFQIAKGEIEVANRKFRLPRSRAARIGLGLAFIAGGLLGFLPVLGFWMLPLGFIILSHDIPLARRWRRRMGLAWARRRREKAEGKR